MLHLDALSHELGVIDFLATFHLVLKIVIGCDSLEFVPFLGFILERMLNLVIIVPQSFELVSFLLLVLVLWVERLNILRWDDLFILVGNNTVIRTQALRTAYTHF